MVHIFTTGGTIDKIYFDAKNAYHVGEPAIARVLREAGVTVPFEVEPVLRKDSLEVTDDDRSILADRIAASPALHVLVTHGTDTMARTAEVLRSVPGKTIVLTGSMQPALFRDTDAVFNIGAAFLAAQALPPGVHIVMQGRVFPAGMVRKNLEKNVFEAVE